MLELSTLTTKSQFNKIPRVIYAVVCSKGSKSHFITKETAYKKMESIEQFASVFKTLERTEYNDLDCKPDYVELIDGTKYELCTHTIEW